VFFDVVPTSIANSFTSNLKTQSLSEMGLFALHNCCR